MVVVKLVDVQRLAADAIEAGSCRAATIRPRRAGVGGIMRGVAIPATLYP